MGKATAHWTDSRLDQLAAAIEPIRAQVTVLDATVRHLDHVAAALEPVPAQLAVLAATVDRLADETAPFAAHSRPRSTSSSRSAGALWRHWSAPQPH